jgi:hypothetical protein
VTPATRVSRADRKPHPAKPATRRLSFLGPGTAFALLAAAAGAAMVAFCWHGVVATVGDDSVSYLTLARRLSFWRPDPLAAPWAPYFANFPPLFPALLAVTGGAYDLLVARMVVAAGAVVSFVLVHVYARERLGDGASAFAVTVLFLLLPGMWLGLAGILSESTYLALSLAAFIHEARRTRPESGVRAYVMLGCLLAAAVLARTAGFALVVAYAARLALEALRARRFPQARRWLPVALPVAAQLAWIASRPRLPVGAYQETVGMLAQLWLQQTASILAESWGYLSRGWIGVFAGDAAGGAGAAAAFGLVALTALAGATRAALHGRLDGWYVLVSAAMLLGWKFNEDNSRRLLYPLLPLVLLHAAEAVRAAAARLGPRLAPWLPRLALAFIAALVLPASAGILRKAFDRDPYFPDLAYRPAAMKEYYGVVDAAGAMDEALRDASVLAGMSYLEQWTEPGSRVMWVRPEYVAVLGRRDGVPLFLRWDRATLAREIRRTRTDFVIASRNFKNDLATDTADYYVWLVRDRPPYLVAVAMLPDATRDDFVLLRVDAQRLERYIAQTEGAPRGPPGPGR